MAAISHAPETTADVRWRAWGRRRAKCCCAAVGEPALKERLRKTQGVTLARSVRTWLADGGRSGATIAWIRWSAG